MGWSAGVQFTLGGGLPGRGYEFTGNRSESLPFREAPSKTESNTPGAPLSAIDLWLAQKMVDRVCEFGKRAGNHDVIAERRIAGHVAVA